MTFLRRQWFLAGLVGVCVLGYTRPSLGDHLNPLVPWLVALIMFLLGAGQELGQLWQSVRNHRAVAVTLANNFLLMPLLAYGLGKILFPADPILFSGLVLMGAVPTTTASSVVWSRLSGGNTSLSLVLTVYSTVASIVALPLILELSLGRSVHLPALDMMVKLFQVIVVPVVLAQLLRHRVPWLRQTQDFSPGIGHALILLIVLTAVSRSADSLTLGLVLLMLVAALLLNTLVSAFSYGLSRTLGISRPDSIAVLFASSQKAVTIGLVVGLLYFDGLAGLPIVVYHVLQQFTAHGWSHLLRRSSEGRP